MEESESLYFVLTLEMLWSLNLAMVPQRAWVYMVERCSPSEMFLAALKVIYDGTIHVWLLHKR